MFDLNRSPRQSERSRASFFCIYYTLLFCTPLTFFRGTRASSGVEVLKMRDRETQAFGGLGNEEWNGTLAFNFA